MVTAAASGMLLAGLLHIAVAAEHWSHAPAHGLFFVIAGIGQIVWSIAFWRTASPPLEKVGFLLAAVLLLLWGLTRILPAPFGHEPEAVEAAGLITKACEAVCVTALVLLMVAGAVPQARARSWRTVVELSVASLVLTGLTYGAARAAEPLLPGLKAEEHTPSQHEHAPGEAGQTTPPATEAHDHAD